MSRERLQHEDLKRFLVENAARGYADIAVIPRAESDGSKTIEIIDGTFTMRDNWFTSEDRKRFHGNEVIFSGDRPFWFMAYSGWVNEEADPKEVYRFLRQALKQPDPILPVRGPQYFSDNRWVYRMDIVEPEPSQTYSDPVDRFSVVESIWLQDHDVGPAAYWGRFTGGMID